MTARSAKATVDFVPTCETIWSNSVEMFLATLGLMGLKRKNCIELTIKFVCLINR